MALSSVPVWSNFYGLCEITRNESDIWITGQNGCYNRAGVCLPMHLLEFFLGYTSIAFEF